MAQMASESMSATAAATSSTTATSAATADAAASSPIYVRYYVGHKGKFGHEFMRFEFQPNGKLRYENNSKYKSAQLIRKEVILNTCILEEVARIVEDSEIMAEDDSNWPMPDDDGCQELEIKYGSTHVSFNCAKIGSILDVQDSEDPEGMRVFYYFVQDLKSLVFSLINLHFKVKPIPN